MGFGMIWYVFCGFLSPLGGGSVPLSQSPIQVFVALFLFRRRRACLWTGKTSSAPRVDCGWSEAGLCDDPPVSGGMPRKRFPRKVKVGMRWADG